MRVLITRPEREAAALAAALAERGHQAVIAPLFQLELLRPADFAEALAACQAVLLTSANGARALAEATEQRSKPVFAVGDATASTAEGLGFGNVASAGGDAAALADLVNQRLKSQDGPLLHASGTVVAGDLAGALEPKGFEVRRLALYEAREVAALPAPARAALQARSLDAAAFFSPRAAALFARLVSEAGLSQACSGLAAVAISPAAVEPLRALPFRAALAAAQPTRQAVLDVIDRLAEAGYQEVNRPTMSDTPSSVPPSPPPNRPVVVRRGLGFVGAFVSGLIAAAIVLVGAVASLPYWPDEARSMWLGGKPGIEADSRKQAEAQARLEAEMDHLQADSTARAQAATAQARKAADDEAKQRAAAAAQQAANEAAKHELDARLDDLEKRVRAAAATAAQADRPATDPAIAELRAKVAALEGRPSDADTVKEVVVLKGEITKLYKAIDDAAAKAKSDVKALSGGEARALAAARASAVIGIAARLSTALDQGQPFAAGLGLLAPFAQDDAKLQEASAALKPLADKGVASRAALAADFPALAKSALADDVADNSFWQRLLGKLRGLVSVRRIGSDVPGDTVEAKLARAEAALNAGDLGKAVELVKSLPTQTEHATGAWLARAEAHLTARRAVDQLSARAVALLGAAQQAQ